MIYREYLPSPALRQYIECYWYHVFDTSPEGEELPVQRCLPLGTAELIVQLDTKPCSILNNGKWQQSSEIYFTGLFTKTAFWKTEVNTPMFGIRLKPESLFYFFDIPAADLLNNVVDADMVFSGQAGIMGEKMFGVANISSIIQIAESYFLNSLYRHKQDRNYVAEACRLIRYSQGGLSVQALSETLYISKRQLQRSFKKQFGASPKTYQRIIRFRNAFQYARKRNSGKLSWTDVSYETGYADQAHFIRDFREFTGDTPSVLARNDQSFFQTLEAAAATCK